ncbi:MAG: hypothetical protein U0165_02960 [Polyangiaceae bacterium]
MLPYLLLNAPIKLEEMFDKPGFEDRYLAIWKLLFALLGIGALLYEAARETEGNPVPKQMKKLAGGLFAVMGIIAYFQFFQIGYREFYHRHEFFHYYLGAKYFKNIGYEKLYVCTAIAEAELGYKKEARERKLRDMRQTNLIVDAKDFVDHPELCKEDFGLAADATNERWESFKRDVKYFRDSAFGGSYWKDMQKDHGYNPPPVWGIMGRFFAELHAPEPWYCQLLSCIDLVLFTFMFAAIAWAFGWRVTCIAILFWGTQDAAPFLWTGGAFLRQDWIFALVLSACMARRRHFAWAGALLTYSTLLRVFPMFFFFGWGVVAAAYIYKHRKLNPIHLQLAKGAIIAGLVLIPASVAVHGVKAWPAFVHHISVHNNTPVTNHMGWKTIIGHSSEGRMQVSRDNKLQDPFEKWKDGRRNRVKALAPIYYGGIAIMMTMLGYACWRLKNLWIVQGLCCLASTILVELTCYYYSTFLLGAMLSKGRRPIELALLAAAALTEAAHLQFGFLDDRNTAFSVIFLSLALFMVAMYSRLPEFVKEKIAPREPMKLARSGGQ